MIEEILLNYLQQSLDVPVYMEIPDVARPNSDGVDPFLVVEKTGSGEENHISTAMVVVQSYAGSLYQAAQLNRRVIRAMKDAISLDTITRVDLNSDYNFTDESTKQPRYQAVFDITYYERGD